MNLELERATFDRWMINQALRVAHGFECQPLDISGTGLEAYGSAVYIDYCFKHFGVVLDPVESRPELWFLGFHEDAQVYKFCEAFQLEVSEEMFLALPILEVLRRLRRMEQGMVVGSRSFPISEAFFAEHREECLNFRDAIEVATGKIASFAVEDDDRYGASKLVLKIEGDRGRSWQSICNTMPILRLMFPEIHRQGIGDLSCQFNARSNELRCAVNPSGPCKGCSYFEARTP